MLHEISNASQDLPIIFPVHPRTAKIMKNIMKGQPGFSNELSDGAREVQSTFSNLYLIEPMGYLNFNYLVKNAKTVITDSGGITEETTVMGIPCITLRNNTERPETVEIGTNELIGTDPTVIKPALEKLFEGNWKKGDIPELWDGKAAVRIVKILTKKIDSL